MGRKSIRSIRQEGIIKAFYKVAKKEGLENTSIAKVADVMDVNPSLIMHYFKTKQDLLHGLIEYILERYRLIYSSETTSANPEVRLKNLIEIFFSRKWNKLFDDGVFYSGYSLIFRNKKIKSHYEKLHEQLRSMLAHALEEAKKANAIKISDVEKTADFIFIIVEGSYYYLSMISDKKEYHRKMQHYKETVLTLLDID